jgi:CDP-glucose 4,6-dehydratase
MLIKKCFEGKTVLVTGHTGFKGSWLSIWMHSLGANVIGLGLDPITFPSHFEAAGIASQIEDRRININCYEGVTSLVERIQPDFVFHLAAQALVKKSYESPVETFTTNVIGTINVLESLRKLTKPCIAILVTSDKCYDNVEWCWGYRETDRIGGSDPYSGSKGAAELAIN